MLNKLMTTTALGLTAGLIASLPAQAGDTDPHKQVYTNNSPIVITGTVAKTSEDAFELRYDDDQTIKVEVDDWDWYDESKALENGEKVTVYGKIDHDLFETRKIEAGSVYAHTRNAYYFASNADEEDYQISTNYFVPTRTSLDEMPDDTWVSVKGTITDVNGQEFTLQLGTDSITIDTDKMSYNPLDDEGFQRLREGDVVYVSGDIDDDFFEAREIDAEKIVTLYTTSKKS